MYSQISHIFDNDNNFRDKKKDFSLQLHNNNESVQSRNDKSIVAPHTISMHKEDNFLNNRSFTNYHFTRNLPNYDSNRKFYTNNTMTRIQI